MTTNLLYLGKLPIKGKNGQRNVGSQYGKTNLRNEKTVKWAIHKHCSPELADKAIHGFRRSTGSPDLAEIDFLRTDVSYHDVTRDWHYQRALRVAERMFRPHRRLKPVSFPDLRFYPWSLPVSAEAPFTREKKWTDIIRQRQADGEDIDGKLTFHNLYNEIFELNRRLVHGIKDKSSQFWTPSGVPIPYEYNSLHTRAHLVKQEDEDKLRAVFGVPKLLLMVENMFVWQLQKEYLNEKVDSPMLWGLETFKGGWKRLYDLIAHKRSNTVISADWSGFDRLALHEVIDDVHNMWRSWFDFDQGYEPTDATDPNPPARLAYQKTTTSEERIQNLWDWMCYSIKHTPIRAESGNLYRWQYNGIASGFQQTQLLDSFVNAIMILTCFSSLGINIESADFLLKVQGDDSLTAFAERVAECDGKDFLVCFADEALRRFNSILSVDKTTMGNDPSDVEVLSYRNKHGIAYRDEAELLAHLLYPERSRGPAELAASAIGIAYAAMGCSHPVYRVCEDVHNFLTKELEVEPDFREWKWMERSGIEWPLPSTQFPTFEETYLQNYIIGGRPEKMKQRLWPTEPTGDYGFYFIND